MTEKKSAKTAQAFSREQILESKRYRDQRDLLMELLEGGKEYTLAQVDTLLETFMKGTVN